MVVLEGARRPPETGVTTGRLESGVLGISECRERCVAAGRGNRGQFTAGTVNTGTSSETGSPKDSRKPLTRLM